MRITSRLGSAAVLKVWCVSHFLFVISVTCAKAPSPASSTASSTAAVVWQTEVKVMFSEPGSLCKLTLWPQGFLEHQRLGYPLTEGIFIWSWAQSVHPAAPTGSSLTWIHEILKPLNSNGHCLPQKWGFFFPQLKPYIQDGLSKKLPNSSASQVTQVLLCVSGLFSRKHIHKQLFYSLPETGFHNRLPWARQLLKHGRKLLKDTKVMKKLGVKLR